MGNKEPVNNFPMVEIFQSIEGEGTKAGFLTTFIRLFGCNLRCKWCDTRYSFPPAQPKFNATISEIIDKLDQLGSKHICLTGGEPLLFGERSQELIRGLARQTSVTDIHIETNGAINLAPFDQLRKDNRMVKEKVRFIMDYKLAGSGESEQMIYSNFSLLAENDEIKFVISSESDFEQMLQVLEDWYQNGQVLISPIAKQISGERLVELMIEHKTTDIKLNLQLHKFIWDPEIKGV